MIVSEMSNYDGETVKAINRFGPFRDLMNKIFPHLPWKKHIYRDRPDVVTLESLHKMRAENPDKVFSNDEVVKRRAEARVREFIKIFQTLNFKPTGEFKTLDFGSGDCQITARLAREFGWAAYATDTDQWNGHRIESQAEEVKFQTLGPDGVIPFHDLQFNLITVLMVLHHIPPEHLPSVFEQFARLIPIGGHLLVREHDIAAVKPSNKVVNKTALACAHLEHAIYNVAISGRKMREFRQDYTGFYRLIDEWVELIQPFGFQKIYVSDQPLGAARYMYVMFRRVNPAEPTVEPVEQVPQVNHPDSQVDNPI